MPDKRNSFDFSLSAKLVSALFAITLAVLIGVIVYIKVDRGTMGDSNVVTEEITDMVHKSQGYVNVLHEDSFNIENYLKKVDKLLSYANEKDTAISDFYAKHVTDTARIQFETSLQMFKDKTRFETNGLLMQNGFGYPSYAYASNNAYSSYSDAYQRGSDIQIPKFDAFQVISQTWQAAKLLVVDDRWMTVDSSSQRSSRRDGFREAAKTFREGLTNIKSDLQESLSRAKQAANLMRNKSLNLTDNLDKVRRLSTNRLLIFTALPIFGFVLLIVFAIPFFMTSNADLQNKLFDNGIILELTTVFMLLAAILILAIGDKIDKEVSAALLGAISTYVLQRSLVKSGTLSQFQNSLPQFSGGTTAQPRCSKTNDKADDTAKQSNGKTDGADPADKSLKTD